MKYLLKNGTVVTGEKSEQLDILVEGEKNRTGWEKSSIQGCTGNRCQWETPFSRFHRWSYTF